MSKTTAVLTIRTRYPGSRPFTAEDRPVFFGRDQYIRKLVTRISVEDLTVLYGRSGLGKSSLLNAGVLPVLEEEHDYFVLPVRFTSCRSGLSRSPLALFDQHLEEHSQGESFLSRIEGEAPSSWQQVKGIQLENTEKSAILLVFDQFEELFTYPEVGVTDFAEALAEIVYDRMPTGFRRALNLMTRHQPELVADDEWAQLASAPRVKVVLSIRSDRLSLLESLSPMLPNILRNCFELRRLSRDDAATAITAPADKEGEFASPPFSWEAAAVTAMLDYLSKGGTSGIDPSQLQVLCQHVEEEIVIGRRDTYVEVPDIGDPDEIYEGYYDRSIAKLDPSEQGRARKLIEEGLVFQDEELRLSLYEGQIAKEYGVDDDLLRQLVETRLVRAEPHFGGGYAFEVSHDSLVRPILRAKARRSQAEERAREAEVVEERKSLKKRKYKRTGLGCGLWILFTLLAVLLAEEQERGGFLFLVLFIPYLVYLSFSLFAPFYILHEYVTEESFLAKLRRRRAEKKKAEREAAEAEREVSEVLKSRVPDV